MILEQMESNVNDSKLAQECFKQLIVSLKKDNNVKKSHNLPQIEKLFNIRVSKEKMNSFREILETDKNWELLIYFYLWRNELRRAMEIYENLLKEKNRRIFNIETMLRGRLNNVSGQDFVKILKGLINVSQIFLDDEAIENGQNPNVEKVDYEGRGGAMEEEELGNGRVE